MHLRYCLMESIIVHNEGRHAQKVMEELGITYKHATPQSMGDCWWFWGCNVDSLEGLPSQISELTIDPRECVGSGLSCSDVEKITGEPFTESVVTNPVLQEGQEFKSSTPLNLYNPEDVTITFGGIEVTSWTEDSTLTMTKEKTK